MKHLLLIALCACACGDTTLLDPMERQAKYKAFAASPFYDDGRAMRQPPAGTVPRERLTQHPEITQGRDRAGNIVSEIPLPVTRELMATGRKQFDIRCSICHGLLGDGVSPISTQMSLRPPPSLHKIHNASPGHLYQVISEGYGLMPSYSAELDARERWAVVAYVQALRKSQSMTLAQAPPEVQARLQKEAAP